VFDYYVTAGFADAYERICGQDLGAGPGASTVWLPACDLTGFGTQEAVAAAAQSQMFLLGAGTWAQLVADCKCDTAWSAWVRAWGWGWGCFGHQYLMTVSL
jgi:hypothetical protein